jgi:hypothetical protein
LESRAMLEANSLLSTSTSSVLADCFLKASGISNVISSAAITPSAKKSIIKKYSSRVKAYASKFPEWSNYADSLSVKINDDESIKVMFTGSDNDAQMVEMLEYGSTSTPPRSVIRVMEEELRQEYIFDIRKTSL